MSAFLKIKEAAAAKAATIIQSDQSSGMKSGMTPAQFKKKYKKDYTDYLKK